MSLFDLVIIAFGCGRIAIGLAPFVAAGLMARLLGFPAKHDTPTTRMVARWFGVRDIGLGVLAFYAVKHPETASFLFLFNAFTDLGDLASIAIPIVKRQGIDRAALLSAGFAFTGGVCWLTAWLIA